MVFGVECGVGRHGLKEDRRRRRRRRKNGEAVWKDNKEDDTRQFS